MRDLDAFNPVPVVLGVTGTVFGLTLQEAFGIAASIATVLVLAPDIWRKWKKLLDDDDGGEIEGGGS